MDTTTLLVALGMLLILFLFLQNSKKKSEKAKQERANKLSTVTIEETTDSDDIPGEVLSAIFMALHEAQEDVHDIEHTILTINPVNRNYSPWSSKFHGLREVPRR